MRVVNIRVDEIDFSDLEGVPCSVRGSAPIRHWERKGCQITEYGCTPRLYAIYYQPTGKEVYIEGTAADADSVAGKIGLIA